MAMLNQLWLPFDDFGYKDVFNNRYYKPEGTKITELKPTDDQAANVGCRVTLLLKKGRFTDAMHEIKNIELDIVGQTFLANDYVSLSETPIANTLRNERALSVLEKENMLYWKDVINRKPTELQEVLKQFGDGCMKDLQSALKEEIAFRRNNCIPT